MYLQRFSLVEAAVEANKKNTTQRKKRKSFASRGCSSRSSSKEFHLSEVEAEAAIEPNCKLLVQRQTQQLTTSVLQHGGNERSTKVLVGIVGVFLVCHVVRLVIQVRGCENNYRKHCESVSCI